MIINGKFTNNEISFDGQLKMNNDGTSLLEINGEYKKDNTILKEDYIYINDSDRVITLKDLAYHKKSSIKSTLSPNIVFIGKKKYNYSLEEIYVKKVVFSLNNINNFYGNDYELLDKNIELKYRQYILKISFSWDFNIGSRKNTIEIISTEKNNFKEYQNIIYKLVTFISFAIGDIANQQHTYFIDKDDTKIEIYYKPSFYKENGKTKQSVLFDIDNKNIKNLFLKWINLIEIAEPLIPLYFMPYFYKIDLNVKYILLVQGLETFHRKITRDDNKIFFERIKDVMFNDTYKKFLLQLSNQEELENLCKKIRTTRNYLTHYSVNQPNEILEGREKIFTCIKIELIIDLYLLKFIGFSEKDFDNIFYSIIKDKFNREKMMQDMLANKSQEKNEATQR